MTCLGRARGYSAASMGRCGKIEPAARFSTFSCHRLLILLLARPDAMTCLSRRWRWVGCVGYALDIRDVMGGAHGLESVRSTVGVIVISQAYCTIFDVLFLVQGAYVIRGNVLYFS